VSGLCLNYIVVVVVVIAAAITVVVALYVSPYSYVVTLELSIKISQCIESNTQT
jgi:hypothetical protein